MLFLQVAQDTLKNKGVELTSSSHSFWFYFEISIIIVVIVYQIYHARNVFFKIEELKNIFNSPLSVWIGHLNRKHIENNTIKIENIVSNNNEENSIEIPIVKTSGLGTICKIEEDINNYLLNNYGADVNFNIIKDIIDRQVEVKDEEISQSITTPLYLGLAATMIGIIFGLLSVPNISGGNFSGGISALISGVKWAMTASLIGLGCTTYLSAFRYKFAKGKLLDDKNKQISKLQADLLPALIDNNQTGIVGLKTTIEKFSRDAVDIGNKLYSSAVTIESGIQLQSKTIETQREIIQKIENIGVTKISKANLELLAKLENNMQSYNKFAGYLELMGQISWQLQDFATRTSNVDSVIKNIDRGLKDNLMLISFITEHFNKIENVGNSALAAVSIADSHFSKAIDKLQINSDVYFEKLLDSISLSSSKFAEAVSKINEEVQLRTEKINQNASDQESKITEIYNEIGNKLKLITNEYLGNLEKSFSESTPDFGQLKHLSALSQLKEQFIVEKGINNDKFVDIIKNLNDSLSKIKANIEQERLLRKIESIEILLKKSDPGRVNKAPRDLKLNQLEDNYSQINEKPVTFLKAINGLIKNQKNGVK